MDGEPVTRPSLLVRLRDPRDDRAWAEFIAIYSPLIYRLARRKGFQDADAADLVQEVLRAAAGAIDRWDPDPARGSFRHWLFKIARNLMINLLERQRRRPKESGGGDIEDLVGLQPARASEDSALFDEEYRRQLFHWAAERVRPEMRASTWSAFWGTAVEGRKAREVGEKLGLSVGAVYMARCRVLGRIREVIVAVEGH
jgi:RNA polymerase sigma factor (sigma-70 family)